jgi:prepilin-type processing-associated H-X9-DG protein/prepilin-type N-terminal cleavage/methylation domain-containing protein
MLPPTAPRAPQPGRTAFSLIELLVVIAIIAVIAGLLLSSIALVKSLANSTKCLSGLRQLGVAMQAYGEDNEDRVPPSKLRADQQAAVKASAYPSGVHWHHLLLAYEDRAAQTWTDNAKTGKAGGVAWSCPLYTPVPWNPGWVGYGRTFRLDLPDSNAVDDWYDLPATAIWFRWSGLTFPSTRIIAGDSANWGLEIAATAPQFHPGSSGFPWSAPMRHRGKANYLFCDGHVATLGAERAWNAIAAPATAQ